MKRKIQTINENKIDKKANLSQMKKILMNLPNSKNESPMRMTREGKVEKKPSKSLIFLGIIDNKKVFLYLFFLILF